MFTFLLIIHIIICVMLIFIVLIQSGSGAQMGAAFGGVGQAHQIRTPESFIAKFTTVIAIIFMITSVGLALLSSNSTNESIIDSIDTEIIETDINQNQNTAPAVDDTNENNIQTAPPETSTPENEIPEDTQEKNTE